MATINATLQASRLYLDANIIIYLQEGAPEIQEAVVTVVSSAVSRGAVLVTSEISIVECLHGALKRKNNALAQSYRAFFADEKAIATTPVRAAILELAAEVGAEYGLKTIDAIHVASAMATGCDMFLTNDMRLRAPTDLVVVRLSDL